MNEFEQDQDRDTEDERQEKRLIFYVVAMDRQRVIGQNGGIPWRLSADLRFFKQVTLNKPVVMGRKTFESIGRPLPDRYNIVLTRQRDYSPPGVVVVHTLADVWAVTEGEPEVAVIGGEEIYRLFWPYVNRLYLTHVDTAVDGDTYFPPFDPAAWAATELLQHDADEKNEYPFRIVQYDLREGES